MAEQLAYYFPTPLPTVPPNCMMHSEPNAATGGIDSWCTYPTPTVVPHLNLSEAFPPYMRFSDSQAHTFFPFTVWGLVGIALIIFALYAYSRWYLMKQKLKESHILLLVKPTRETVQQPLATEQLFAQLHALVSQQTLKEQLLLTKKSLSVELVATKEEGIRYLIHTPLAQSAIIKKTLLSYLPGVEVTEVPDYLPSPSDNSVIEANELQLVSFGFARHFALPLQSQTVLAQHDPIAYLTGTMTKLAKGELVALQLVIAPVTPTTNYIKSSQAHKILNHLWHGKDLTPFLHKRGWFWYLSLPMKVLGTLLYWFFSFVFSFLGHCMDIFTHQQGRQTIPVQPREKPVFTPSVAQQALFADVDKKLSQPLFETSMRLLVITHTHAEGDARVSGVMASLASFDNSGYQALVSKSPPFTYLLPERLKQILVSYMLFQLRNRLLSFSRNLVLSVSELASLYHLPYTTTTKTEDMVKVMSPELPAPLSLKQAGSLDITFASNTYGGHETPIGLTRAERGRHMALFGTTGAGKSTMLLTMMQQDILHGEGVLLIDPHGDLALKALSCIPDERSDDLVWIEPDDLAHPVGLNLMELTPNLSEYDALREKEFIAESIISLFRKVFSDSLAGNPHRIEYILRNTIHTAFTVEDATIFTIYDLLTDAAFRMQVTKKLTDKRLQGFWKTEFSKASGWQQVKMIAPVTARIGRFLFSPSARRILEQPKSTINFDALLDQKKIVLCRFALGELGEDTAQVLGIMMLNKIQLAALKRARRPEEERTDFFVYVDEFQNFATDSFMQMLSQTRKYKVNFIVAEQTTAQQRDKTLTNIMLANIGTVGVFKLASPHDEQFLYPQFAPTVERGALANLPAFHFYMKKGAMIPEDPFSGITIPVKTQFDSERNAELISRSNDKYTRVDEAHTEQQPVKKTVRKQPKKTIEKQQKITEEGFYPEENMA